MGLLFLMVMTVLSLTAARILLMETMMTNNTQFVAQALGDAEGVIRSGERNIETLVSDGIAQSFTTEGDAYYPIGEIDPSQANWAGPEGFSFQTTPKGAYVIEYAGARSLPGESVSYNGGIAGSAAHLFRVSGYGMSGKGARRIVQTLYATDAAP